MKALHIDAANKRVVEVEYETVADIRRFIGGPLELGHMWSNQDTLFVDEEGMRQVNPPFFWLKGKQRPFIGSGLVVGREHESDVKVWTDPPRITVEQLTGLVRFVSREQVDAWAKANASEAGVTISFGADPPTVLATIGEMFGSIPRPPSIFDGYQGMWWGLRPPADATPVAAYGCRAILGRLADGQQTIEIVHDRQSFHPVRFSPAFQRWLASGFLAWIRSNCGGKFIDEGGEKMLQLDAAPFHARATARKSFGYLYIGAWCDR
jgi:hypothetical protein